MRTIDEQHSSGRPVGRFTVGVTVLAGILICSSSQIYFNLADEQDIISGDLIISAVDAGLRETLKDFELSEPIETSLSATALRGKVGKDGRVLITSITIIRPDECGIRNKQFEKTFETGFTLRMSKVCACQISSPMALITETRMTDERVAVKDRLFFYDSKHNWIEVK